MTSVGVMMVSLAAMLGVAAPAPAVPAPSVPAPSVPAPAGNVTVSLSGLKSGKGKLYVALQRRDEFLQERVTAGQVFDRVEAGSRTVRFDGVAAGDYSVSVWHDLDGDGRFSRSANGAPLDGWSILHAATLRAAPTWDAVKFSVGGGDTALDLAMVYPD